MSFSSNISVNISLDSPPLSQAGFGTMLILSKPGNLGVGFTERLRRYSGPEAVSADADLSSEAQAALLAGFGQEPRPAQIAVGKVDTFTAQVVDVVVGGADDGAYVITINGNDYTFNASSNSLAEIADGLAPLVNADADVGAVSDSVDTVTITASDPGKPFTIAVSAPNDNLTATETTANNGLAEELAAILDEDGDWYGLINLGRDEVDIEQGAIWTEANERLFLAQSNEAGILTTATDDIASVLQDASYKRTAVFYYSDDGVYADAAWMATKLAADPDETSTIWAYKTLSGIAKDSVTDTQKGNLLAKNANAYLDFYGAASTGEGKLADGTFLDLRITADWLKARLETDFAQILRDASQINRKVPYTNAGFTIFEEKVRSRVKQGVDNDHFVDNTLVVNIPDLADVDPADRSNREFNFSFSVEPAGAIQKSTITGYVSVSV